MKFLEIDGIKIETEKKNIKNLYIRIKASGKVKLTAPPGTAEADMEAFALRKLRWIKAKLEEAAGLPGRGAAPARTFSPEDRERFRIMCGRALARWQPLVGRRASSFTVRDMVSRWGSCNTVTGRLCFNLKLMNLDPVFPDYVVCHELCHLLFPGHGPEFWNKMEEFFPGCKDVRKALRSVSVK